MNERRIANYVPGSEQWEAAVPDDLPETAKEGYDRMTWGHQTWWPGRTEPFLVDPVAWGELRGHWYGALNENAPNHGTLWHANAYNLTGEINGLTLWRIGDFRMGREGHGLYVRTVPHLDFTIRNYRAFKLGGQAVQREWRTNETDIPASVWKDAGGWFTLESCVAKETGLIDTATGGNAVRASWAFSLYNTGQHTTVRDCRHVNYHSAAPHEGSLFVGPGYNAWRTPTLAVEGGRFMVNDRDRADVFLWSVDAAEISRLLILSPDPMIDVVEDCGPITFRELPRAVTVRVKHGHKPHGSPKAIVHVPAGGTMTFTP